MQRIPLSTTDPPPASASPMDLIRARQRELLGLLDSVRRNVASEPQGGDTERTWVDFRTALVTQLDEEDRELIPIFSDSAERDARVLVQEHRHIRDRVKEIDVSVAERRLRPSDLHDLSAVLRGHFRNEERMLGRRYCAHNDNG